MSPPPYFVDWNGDNHAVGDWFVLTTTWTGRFPGDVEGCVECHVPLEVMPGQRRVGVFRFHLFEPDLICDTCVASQRADLLPAVPS